LSDPKVLLSLGLRSLTLRAQLLLALGLLTALPIVLLGIVEARANAQAAAALADRETLLASTSLARELGRLMESHANIARALAGDAATSGNLDAPVWQIRADQYINTFPGFYGLTLLDMKGMAVGGTVLKDGVGQPAAGRSYADRVWVQEVQRGAALSAEIVRSRVSGRPAVSLAAPVVSADGTRLGMVGLGIDLQSVQQALERVTEAAPGLSSVVTDGGGRVVARAGAQNVTPLEELGTVALYWPTVGDQPERRTGADETGELRRGTVAALQTNVVRWWVTTTWPQAAVAQRASKALWSTLGFGLGALALGIGAAVLLAKTVAQPVSRLSVLVESIGHGDLRARPEQPRAWYPRELSQLIASIDRMLSQLQGVMAQLGRTAVAIGQVTHRLQGASTNLLGDSYQQKEAIHRSSGAIVQMSDSIGNVGNSVRALSDAASETTTSISSLDQQIDRIAHNLLTLADTIASTSLEVDHMQQQVAAVATSALQLGQNVEKTSGSLQLLTESIQDVANSAGQGQALAHDALAAAAAGRDAVDGTIAATREIQHRFDAVGAAVHSLAGRSEAIGEVVRVIEEVTRATQLVAINASILASEAGEHGKGFRVVADRVRSMADETAVSTDQISKLIASVQADIKNAVDAVKAGQETMRAGERRSEEAGVRLLAIIDSSGQAEGTVKQIAEATRDQALRVRLVRAALGEVHQATARIAHAVDAQREAQGKMAVAMTRLRSVGEDVRSSNDAQQKDSRAMTAAVRAMTSRFQSIAQAIEAQNQERVRIQMALGVFDTAAKGGVESAQQIGEVVHTLRERLDQLERQLSGFRTG
jgi:methyl-accepting chemotaxis protein